MPNDDKDVTEDELTVKTLTVPKFESKLPKALLEGISQRDRELWITVFRMADQMQWLCEVVPSVFEHLRHLEREEIRLKRMAAVTETSLTEDEKKNIVWLGGFRRWVLWIGGAITTACGISIADILHWLLYGKSKDH